MKNIFCKLTVIIVFSFPYSNLYGQTTQNCEFNNGKLVPQFTTEDGAVLMDTALYSYEHAPELPLGDFDNENKYENYLDSMRRNRIIFWAHGLGGDEESWRPAMNNVSNGSEDGTFPARDVFNYTMKYTNGNISMRDCGATLGQGLQEKVILHQQDSLKKHFNMIISHSQGGIVSRTLNQLKENQPNNQDFGGIVFFTVPNDGAYILKSAKNGAGLHFSSWACHLLAAPKIKEKIEGLPWIAKLLVNENDISKNITNVFCDNASNVVNYLLNTIAEQAQTDDYLPGAKHLSDLKELEMNPDRKFKTHRVNFYSEEPDEGYLIWRTLQYQWKSPLVGNNFSANADNGKGTLKYEVDDFHQKYIDKYEEYKWLYIFSLDCMPGNTLGYFKCKKYKKLKDSFKNAFEFFEDSNKRWKVIIGARYQEIGCMITGYEYVDLDNPYHTVPIEYFFEGVTDEAECNQIVSDFKADQNVQSVYGSIRKGGNFYEIPSDGIVTVESQANLPGHNVINQKIYNSSHMQIRNDDNLKQSLMKLFDAELNSLPEFINSEKWFKTPTKN